MQSSLAQAQAQAQAQARLSAQLDWHVPIIQAPMVGVSTPALAAAVSNAGALGSIAIGNLAVDDARQLIAQTRALTARAFNVNVFCHPPARAQAQTEAAWLQALAPWFEANGLSLPLGLREPYRSFLADRDMLEMLLQTKPAVVSFHFGLPPHDWVGELRRVGILTLACVTHWHEAMLSEAAGVDALVVQGSEAGGHRGCFDARAHDPMLGLSPLLRALASRVQRPLIAAGGIMDGQGMAAAMALGACAVQMGTAFIACEQSSASSAHRLALASAQAWDTRVSAHISGRRARGLPNAWHSELAGALQGLAVPDYPIAYDAGKALARAGEPFVAHWAGQGAPLARAMPAAELVRVLAQEWRACSMAAGPDGGGQATGPGKGPDPTALTVLSAPVR